MKRIALLLFLSCAALHADDLTKKVQMELKQLGFFYAEANGTLGPETTAAIRRYQIRNGYEVTGTLTKETLAGLGLGGAAPAPAATPPPPAAMTKKAEEPVHLRRDETLEESDRNFLKREAARSGSASERDPSRVSPPVALNPPPDPGMQDYSHIFARTPYETAPAEVQVSTLRKAQTILARGGYYRDFIDGIPGPATEEAILSYQRRQRLIMTGRLDLETLDAMSLLPGEKARPYARPFTVPRGSRFPPRVLRGIWVD